MPTPTKRPTTRAARAARSTQEVPGTAVTAAPQPETIRPTPVARPNTPVDSGPAGGSYIGGFRSGQQAPTVKLRQIPCPHCLTGYVVIPEGMLPKGTRLKVDDTCSQCGRSAMKKLLEDHIVEEVA